MRPRTCVLLVALVMVSRAAIADDGFGRGTVGGDARPAYHVTSLRDSGPGSLREAVSQGSRQVVFDVAGDIDLSSNVYMKGAFITIDGSTAPAPGITLRHRGLVVHDTRDVIIRGIRLRGSRGCDHGCTSSGAGLVISRGAYNVVLDRVSVTDAEDQALSIGKQAHDITVQWSLFGNGAGHNLPVLISTGTQHISMHHNLLINGHERLPQVKYSDSGAQSPGTQLDFQNNLVWDWQSMGSMIWKGTVANVVANYYGGPNADVAHQRRAIFFQKPARAFIAGNVSAAGPAVTAYLNALGTERQPFPAPPIAASDACPAAQLVLMHAGVRPLDDVDRQLIASIQLRGCAEGPGEPVAPAEPAKLVAPSNRRLELGR